MRDDTAFMDRLHAYVPDWDLPKMQPDLFTEHFGLVSDFSLTIHWPDGATETHTDVAVDRLLRLDHTPHYPARRPATVDGAETRHR